MERDEHDLLTKAELCKLLGIGDTTVDRWVTDRLLPRPVKYGRQPRWRWGVLKRWMEATEFFQTAGLELPPADDGEETALQHLPPKGGHSAPSGPTDGSEASDQKKRR